jgi:hypothetical protein
LTIFGRFLLKVSSSFWKPINTVWESIAFNNISDCASSFQETSGNGKDLSRKHFSNQLLNIAGTIKFIKNLKPLAVLYIKSTD